MVSPPLAPFIEPAALMVLRSGSVHGYDLADKIGELIGVDKVDYGNLYRMLRRMEQEDLLSSVWDDENAGRSKRVYDITDEGEKLLTAWVAALESLQERVTAFLESYHEGV